MQHVLAVAVLLLVLAPFARAQEGGAPVPPPADPPPSEEKTPPSTEPQSLEPGAPAPSEPVGAGAAPGRRGASAFTWGDSTGIVLPPLADVRTPAELDADYAAWKQARANSEGRMLKARERSLRWKSSAELQKSQIELLGKQVDAAKKEKREADKKDAEAAKKREEKKREYYDTMRQVMEAGAEYHKAVFDLASGRMSAIDQERKLHEKWSNGGYEARISADARALEQKVLALVKKDAELLSAVSSREKTMADRSLDALKLWAELQK